ncbi:MAG: hypothetical protein K2N42_03690, partial [Anaeroplasmataceae bacterium]|nr:hypothetical protein [Anaeroplasmataceae bacterium]
MKKLSITGQIALLFSFVLIISAALFTTVTLNRLKFVAEQETYSRLMTYSSLLDSHNQRPDEVIRDMEIGFVKTNETTIYTNDISSYMSEKELKNVLDHFTSQNKPVLKRKMINLEGKTIYYVVNRSADGKGINVIMTNSLYVNNLSRSVSFQLITAFVIIICLATVCIVVWSNQFTRRLHHLQGHILELPKNGYNV